MTEAEIAKVRDALLKSRHALTMFLRPGDNLLAEEAAALAAIDEALAMLDKRWVL